MPGVVAVDRLEADAERVDLVAHGRGERAEIVREHASMTARAAGRMLPSGATASS